MKKMKVGYVGFVGHRRHKVHIIKESGEETPFQDDDSAHPNKEREVDFAISLCGINSRDNGCKGLVWDGDASDVQCATCMKKRQMMESRLELHRQGLDSI
jgi:hypothetical protein